MSQQMSNNGYMYHNNCNCNCTCDPQEHVHEVEGSVQIVGIEEQHNHRFAGITEEAIRVPGGHIHILKTKTDFCKNHFHKICVKTDLQIKVGTGEEARHVHYIDSATQAESGHLHEFIAATLIVG